MKHAHTFRRWTKRYRVRGWLDADVAEGSFTVYICRCGAVGYPA